MLNAIKVSAWNLKCSLCADYKIYENAGNLYTQSTHRCIILALTPDVSDQCTGQQRGRWKALLSVTIVVEISWNSLRKLDVNLPAVPSVCLLFVFLRETPLLSIKVA